MSRDNNANSNPTTEKGVLDSIGDFFGGLFSSARGNASGYQSVGNDKQTGLSSKNTAPLNAENTDQTGKLSRPGGSGYGTF